MSTSQPDDVALAILVTAITVGTIAACCLGVLVFRALHEMWRGLFGEEATD